MDYKKEEIQEYFNERIGEYSTEYISNNLSDIHHEIFNTDYYIIGSYKAQQWLGDKVFEVINFIKDYEQFHFGEVTTDLSCSEKVVNMYVYIIGLEIVAEFVNKFEHELAEL